MSWYRIILSREQIKAGETKVFHQKFRDAFHEAGMPGEMGLFTGQPVNDGDHPFYLTPACSKPASDLISYYAGESCEKPKKGGLEPSLVIGFNKVWDLLLE